MGEPGGCDAGVGAGAAGTARRRIAAACNQLARLMPAMVAPPSGLGTEDCSSSMPSRFGDLRTRVRAGLAGGDGPNWVGAVAGGVGAWTPEGAAGS